jgi:phage terminase large subunit GpA-like protein
MTYVIEAIPPIAPAGVIVAGLARENLTPLEKLTVAEAAEKYRILDNKGGGYCGPWRFDLAPYLYRPHSCLTDDLYRIVVIMGPAQSGKSEVANNWLLHSAITSPASMIWLQADRAIMGDYVREKIDPMIELSPELRSRLLTDVGSDNVYRKAFRGRMIVNFIWPVGSQLRMRSSPRFVIDDYDDVPDDIGGQGDALTLLGGRQTTFEGREKGFVTSSPSLGKNDGIEALTARGTDERLHVACVECGERFILDSDQLTYEKTDTPMAAERSAMVVCPVNGCLIEPRRKAELVRTGVWAGPQQMVMPDGRIEGDAKETDIASFRIDGLFGFASWARLAGLKRAAELTFEQTQDEGELRGIVNTRFGKNYVSQIAGLVPIEADSLTARVDGSEYEIGTVPDWVKCLTAAVDVQGNRFEVLVVGWGEGWRTARIDRFPILAIDDGETKIDPSGRPEHWGVLLSRVMWRRYPMAGKPEFTMPILCTAIDTGGEDGVTDNAFAFWSTAMRAGVPPTAVTLIKGGNNPKGRLLPPPTVDAKRKGAPGDPDPELFVPNVNRIKSMIDVRLRRTVPGPGYMDYPRGFAREYLDETTAETRSGDLWERPRGRANETLDLEVYNIVVTIRLGGADSSLAWVPAWAAPKETGAAADVPRLTRSRPRIRVRR